MVKVRPPPRLIQDLTTKLEKMPSVRSQHVHQDLTPCCSADIITFYYLSNSIDNRSSVNDIINDEYFRT